MTSAAVINLLIDRRILKPHEVVRHGVALRDQSRGRFLLRTLLVGNRPRMILKQAHSQDGLIQLRNELRCLRQIRSTAARAVVPACYMADPSHGLLAMEYLGSKQSASWNFTGSGVTLTAESALELGTVLGHLHQQNPTTAQSSLPDDLPWIMSAFESSPAWRPSTFEKVLSWLEGRGWVQRGLRLLQADWQRPCLIHGDLKMEHCMERSGPKSSTTVLIDWELAKWGDPAWDVAGAFYQELLRLWLQSSAGSHVSADQARTLYFGSLMTMMEIFGFSYVPLTRQIGTGADSFIRRLILCLGARLMQLCFESIENDNDNTAAHPSLRLAELCFAQLPSLAGILRASWPH